MLDSAQRQNHGLGRRKFLRSCALAVAGGALFAHHKTWAQQAPASAGPASPQLIEDLVAANRIIADQGVVDGYGHVSVRHDKDPNRYLISRSLAPALVTAEDIVEYDLDSRPVDPRGRSLYSEVFIHGEIYKVRPDVNAVVHSHAPSVIALGIAGITPRPVYHMSSFIARGVPVFDIREEMGEETDMLVRHGGPWTRPSQDSGESSCGLDARPRGCHHRQCSAAGCFPERLSADQLHASVAGFDIESQFHVPDRERGWPCGRATLGPEPSLPCLGAMEAESYGEIAGTDTSSMKTV